MVQNQSVHSLHLSGVFDINGSNGQLSIKLDLSGSTTQSGDSISSTITFTNSFGTTTETYLLLV